MKIQIRRDEDYLELRSVTIEINGCRYRLSETVDNRLKVKLTVNQLNIFDDEK